MAILHFTLVFTVLILAIWLFRQYRHHALEVKDQNQVAQQALEACRKIIELVVLIQQHRGMSTAWLAGDKAFSQRLLDKRIQIQPLLSVLSEIAGHENEQTYPCFTPNDIALWRHRWQGLVAELEGWTVEKSIMSHSNLIASLLNWLDALGEARIELPMGKGLSSGLVRNFCHRLPHLAETLGQVRATGSGVAAQGTCSAVARVRMMFLLSRAESLVSQACEVDAKGADAALKVRALAVLTREKMLNSQHVEATADSYFAEASRAIDTVFDWVADCRIQLEHSLSGK